MIGEETLSYGAIVKRGDASLCVWRWRSLENHGRGCPRGCVVFEKVGILERKQMAHIKSKGPL